MRNNHFSKLMKYMRKVYNIEQGLNRLTDGRVNPKYKTGQVILPLLLGFMLRIESMNELKYMLKGNEFRNVFRRGSRLPQIDTIRDTLKVIDLDGLEVILENTIKKAIKNKVYRNGRALSLQNSKTPYFKGAPSYSEKCIKFRMTASLQDCHYLC